MWDGNGAITGTEPVGLFPPTLGESRTTPHRWDSGALPVSLPDAITVGGADCLANGAAFAKAIPADDATGGFLPSCYLPVPPPNPDLDFGFSVWSCPTQLFWADVITLLYANHLADAASMCGTQFRNATITTVAATTLYPAYVLVNHSQYVCLACAGTGTLYQSLVQALNLAAGPQDYGNFGTGTLWYDFASVLYGQLNTQNLLDGRPLLVAGHSYGGAAALILAARISLTVPKKEIRYITYGCPKPGDARLSALLQDRFEGLSLVNDGDLITALPPSAAVIAALSDFLPVGTLSNWTRWAYPPETTLMRGPDLAKNTYQRYDSLTLAKFILAVATTGQVGSVPGHTMAEYGQAIRARCTRMLPTFLGEVLGTKTTPGFVGRPGEVLGIVIEPGPITTVCCPTGTDPTVTVTITAADPPNAFLVGQSWTATYNAVNKQWFMGTAGPPPPPEGFLQCNGPSGWQLRFEAGYIFNAVQPPTCSPISFSSVISTNAGSSHCTVVVSWGPVTTLVSDTFTDTDGTSLATHTIAPINVPGTAWTLNNFGFAINSNMANPTGGYNLAPNAIATVDAGQADVTVTVQVVFNHNNVTDSGIVCRYVDNNNFWIATLNISNGTFSIYERLAGSFVLRVQASLTVTIGTTYTIQMIASGSSLSATVNGGSGLAWSSTDFQTATRHGIRTADNSSSTANTFDNFTITHP